MGFQSPIGDWSWILSAEKLQSPAFFWGLCQGYFPKIQNIEDIDPAILANENIITGWWSGTSIYVPINIGLLIIPIDEVHHFSEGFFPTTNQMKFPNYSEIPIFNEDLLVNGESLRHLHPEWFDELEQGRGPRDPPVMVPVMVRWEKITGDEDSPLSDVAPD